MIYPTPDAWRAAPEKHVLLFGMSGLGKTHIAKCLRAAGGWFHYSVDYRIGTRYMGELIADNAKREAMKVPFLRELLLSDSIHIQSNITFDNLDPVCPSPSISAAKPSSARPRSHRSSTRPASSSGPRHSTATRTSSATRAGVSANGWTPRTRATPS
jgi:hypothetical protein